MEVSHTDLAEEPRMVLIEEDPVVVHASGVTTTTRVLPVLADSSMAGADVASLLPVLLESGRHLLSLSLWIFSHLGFRRLREEDGGRVGFWGRFIWSRTGFEVFGFTILALGFWGLVLWFRGKYGIE